MMHTLLGRIEALRALYRPHWTFLQLVLQPSVVYVQSVKSSFQGDLFRHTDSLITPVYCTKSARSTAVWFRSAVLVYLLWGYGIVCMGAQISKQTQKGLIFPVWRWRAAAQTQSAVLSAAACVVEVIALSRP